MVLLEDMSFGKGLMTGFAYIGWSTYRELRSRKFQTIIEINKFVERNVGIGCGGRRYC
jgi:hypothetical protein